MNNILTFLTEKPEILVTVLCGFLLPIILVWLNNFYNLKLKNKEKELDVKFIAQEELRKQEKSVYASLSKILFDVQLLHVSLSGTCIDENCIESSIIKFDESIIKYHEEIANNLLYMPSFIIDRIYKFYSKLSDLKISLKELNIKKNYEMAQVLVYVNSTELAETLIEIQENLIGKRPNLKIDFDKTQQKMMKYCCGTKPSKDLFNKYLELLKEINPTISTDELTKIENRWKE
jgi:hypothetical protein